MLRKRYLFRVFSCLAALMFLASASAVTAFASAPFEGYKVTVLDKTTPAVNMRGRVNDRNVLVFVSADDKEVGVMSRNDYLAVIEKHKIVVQVPAGGTLYAPPNGYSNWHNWFADEFNKQRSLTDKSRTEAVASSAADTIEEYRQELIRLVNLEREKAGLLAYIVNDKCMEYSQIRAEELAVSFSHTRPDGTNAGYEIIALGRLTPEGTVHQWMNSPGHKAAILNANRVYAGAGCNVLSNGVIHWQMYFERDPEVYANTLIFG